MSTALGAFALSYEEKKMALSRRMRMAINHFLYF